MGRKNNIGPSALLVLAALLVMPGLALSRLADSVNGWLLVAVPFGISVLTFFAYRSDKRRAEAGEWRIPEATLHFAELIGGWPGAFLAQRMFRHKTSRVSFQSVFWFIVMLHEYMACDALTGWRFTREAIRFVEHPRV